MAICFHSPLDTAQSIFYVFGMIIQASEIKSLQSPLIGWRRCKYRNNLARTVLFECVKLGNRYTNRKLFSKLFVCVWFTMCFLVYFRQQNILIFVYVYSCKICRDFIHFIQCRPPPWYWEFSSAGRQAGIWNMLHLRRQDQGTTNMP